MQRKSFRSGLLIAALAPTAVLLLAIQTTFFHDGGIAAALILGETLAVLIVLLFGFLDLGSSHHEWIAHRMKAELLRREQFLFRTRVGPYRHTSAASVHGDVRKRLLILDEDIEEDVLALTVVEEPIERPTESADEFDVRLATDYLDQRVRDQRVWFARRAVQHETRDRRLEWAAKVVLVFAFLVAGMHLTDLLGHHDHEASVRVKVMLIAAFVLPPLGAALVGVRALLEGKRLSRAYQYNARCLAELERELMTLVAECAAGVTPSAGARFRRLVMKTEDLLAAELRQWWIVMHPAPSIGA